MTSKQEAEEEKAKKPRVDFMPNWKKQDQCFEEEQVEMVDSLYGNKIMKNGKPVVKA